MNVKTPTAFLRVDWLESRCLLNGAAQSAPTAVEPERLDPPEDYGSWAVRVAAPVSPRHPAPPGSVVPYGDDDDRSAGSEPPVAVGTAPAPVEPLAGARAQYPGAPGAGELEDRDDSAGAPVVPQLAIDPAHESPPPDRPAPISPSQMTHPGTTDAGGSPKEIAVPASGDGPPVRVAGNPVGSSATEVADLPDVGPLSVPESKRAAPGPAEPAATGAGASPGAAVPVDGAEPSDRSTVLLDRLPVVPAPIAAALNLSALGTDAEIFFSHLSDLGPEWPGAIRWSEYVCIGACVLFLAGGYFIRRANVHRTSTPGPAPLEPPERAS
jgi:hypothetical protein